MQLTGIKTIGKMTDYTGIEVCVYASMHTCTFFFFFLEGGVCGGGYFAKIAHIEYFPTHVLEY